MYKGELAELLKPKPISWVIKRTKLNKKAQLTQREARDSLGI